jgi:hypothetical protein
LRGCLISEMNLLSCISATRNLILRKYPQRIGECPGLNYAYPAEPCTGTRQFTAVRKWRTSPRPRRRFENEADTLKPVKQTDLASYKPRAGFSDPGLLENPRSTTGRLTVATTGRPVLTNVKELCQDRTAKRGISQ